MKVVAATASLAVGVLLLAAMQQVAGAFGAALVCTVAWVVALLLLRSRLAHPHPPARQPAHQPPAVHTWPSFRRVENRLWSAVRSPRLYDHSTRPLVSRVTATLLEHHAGVDLTEEPERAQGVLGDDVWPLVDPRHVPSDDNEPPGVPPEALDRLLTRLEAL